MLQLKNVHKEYKTGDFTQIALNDVSLNFRDNEFVAILGPSGSGKTTMLNIIGGLDKYDSGDLIINGISTKKYKDRDWDTYRNHSIGFVFQSYNLIPHQTILSNVELALTLTGVSKSERRKRAKEALKKVGLEQHIHKKPNQMSGGQMQRVAIARALINNPDILLADEPTGALDSETSVQIMNLLKEIAKDKLIIMVTHNPELAEEYANRIVRFKDGSMIDDTNPYEPTEEEIKKVIEESSSKVKKPSMSYLTAISLSFNNLLTKKGRTFMVAFAGSIGIIGIALILSLSNGVNRYIDNVQRDTLSTYPISIETAALDMNDTIKELMGQAENQTEHDKDAIYENTIMTDMMAAMTSQIGSNDLKAFKAYLDKNRDKLKDDINDIKYSYNLDLQIYSADTSNGIFQLNPSKFLSDFGYGATSSEESNSSTEMMTLMSGGMSCFEQMIDNQEVLEAQYDIVAGKWPTSYNEVVLVVNENNEISDMVLYALGLKDYSHLKDMQQAILNGEAYTGKGTEKMVLSYDDILKLKFKLVLNSDYYTYDETRKCWVDNTKDNIALKNIIDNSIDISIVGIIKPNESVTATSITNPIGYTSALTTYVINAINASEVVKAQKANPDVDIFTNLPFKKEDTNLTLEEIQQIVSTLPEDQQQMIMQMQQSMTEEEFIVSMTNLIMSSQDDKDGTYEGNLKKLGVVDLDVPSRINIYPATFEAKDNISQFIEDYNNMQIENGNESAKISYTDYIGIFMSSVSTIINVISYILIAFVGVSLVVSSIMIGIITYISVLERTKEIGILRAIGASKRDISRVFNAETLIVGLTAGLLGVAVTLLLLIPANVIIDSLLDAGALAYLGTIPAIILVLISVILTTIAGLIPSRLAAKKDPVIALRTE